MKYCSECGGKVVHRIPIDDDRKRFVCDACGIIYYNNPKVVVGCIPVWEDRILFCRRAIEPCYGKWTIPAGYLENGETVEEGAMRETYEEAGATIEHLKPYALYNITFINQIYLFFRAGIKDGDFKAGRESLEVRLLTENEIPWDDLAFKAVRSVLRRYVKNLAEGVFPFRTDDILQDFNFT
ncbi:NUDIX hydrolase [Thermodesulfobacteriota bacterium]